MIITQPISNIQGGPCPLLVIQVADTDSPYDGVISVLRHWHPVKFASIKVINVSYDGKMDSSVKHWNDRGDWDGKRRILKRQASKKSYAKSSIYGIYIIFMHIMVFIINGELYGG